MQGLVARVFVLLMAILLSQPLAAATSEDRQLLETVRGFYGWVLRHGEAVNHLQPKIEQVPQSTRLYLDVTSLSTFTYEFMGSGYFAPTFPEAVKRYYLKQQARLEAMKPKEFDHLAEGGRGPMMETEDMDIFFCAQEYERTERFIHQMKIKSSHGNHRTATATVASPSGWETSFRFSKVKDRWLIAGYCVYQ